MHNNQLVVVDAQQAAAQWVLEQAADTANKYCLT